MSLTRPQIILLKNAQREAGLDDADYRDAIATITGMPDCRSAKDPRLTDDHLDKLLKWFEAIYWAAHPACRDEAPCEGGSDSHNSPASHSSHVFRERDHWKNKNQRGNTSRDRFTAGYLDQQITDLENQLHALGYGFKYLQAIQNNLRKNGAPLTKTAYLGAVARTVKAKQKKETQPF